MSVSYLEVFVALLVLYCGWSWRVKLDPRYPVVLAVVIAVGAAALQILGNHPVAVTLTVFTVLLVIAGVALFLVEYVRDARMEATRDRL